MRVLRTAGGALLLVLTGVVGLLGVLLSVTLILLPLGVPLLFLARKLFGYSMTLFLPRAVRHPAKELGKQTKRRSKKAGRQIDQKVRRRDRSLLGRLKRAF